MLKSFYDNYEADEFLFSEGEVSTLMKFIQPEYKDSFQKDFISQFKEGVNFVMMGY